MHHKDMQIQQKVHKIHIQNILLKTITKNKTNPFKNIEI